MLLIIGYGNPLRRDDGLGWYAAGKLKQLLSPDEAEIILTHQLTPELAEPLSRASLVVFIDAGADQPPGTIQHMRLDPAATAQSPVTHHVDAPALLAYGRILYGANPDVHLFTVGGQDFGFGEGLSPLVEQAAQELIARVYQLARSG